MRAPCVDSEVFIIRLWQDPASDHAAAPPWRGEVEHLASRRRGGFATLDRLRRFIAECCGIDLGGHPPAASARRRSR
jgi:hypothetical protein